VDARRFPSTPPPFTSGRTPVQEAREERLIDASALINSAAACEANHSYSLIAAISAAKDAERRGDASWNAAASSQPTKSRRANSGSQGRAPAAATPAASDGGAADAASRLRAAPRSTDDGAAAPPAAPPPPLRAADAVQMSDSDLISLLLQNASAQSHTPAPAPAPQPLPVAIKPEPVAEDSAPAPVSASSPAHGTGADTEQPSKAEMIMAAIRQLRQQQGKAARTGARQVLRNDCSACDAHVALGLTSRAQILRLPATRRAARRAPAHRTAASARAAPPQQIPLLDRRRRCPQAQPSPPGWQPPSRTVATWRDGSAASWPR